ncbi:MAG: hypothetical protein M0T74_01930 [Desulfitobacterium hafniense]|nr:hypothetical protein [Desulfitobacterium hafniense]
MKTFRINIYEAGFYFLVALATGIFLVLPVTLDTWRTILATVSIFFVLVYFMTHKKKQKCNNKYLLFYISFLVLTVGFETARAVSSYEYSVYELFYSLREYIWILLVIPLFLMFKHKGDFKSILRNIINITLVSLFIRFVTWVVYSFTGITLFSNVLYEYGISWGRNGTARIDATPLIGVVIVSLYYFYIETKNKKYLIKLLFVFFYLLVVTQTRTLLISSLFCCAIMIFFQKRKPNVRFVFQVLALTIVVGAILLGAFDKLLDYLGLSSGVIGLDYRYFEFNYYLGLLGEGNWKLGLGILTTINPASNSFIFGNLDTKMYLDDLGFLGCFVQFGLLSILMYGLLYFYMFKVMRKCFKVHQDNYGLLMMGLLSYIFMISIPLNLFGIQRSFSLPIILAVTGYIESLCKVGLKK